MYRLSDVLFLALTTLHLAHLVAANGEVTGATHGPWANRPKCYENSSKYSDNFCIYISSTFNHGAGICLIMRHRNALSFAETIQAHKPAPQSWLHLRADEQPSEELVYEITNQPFKGDILLARKEINSPDLVLTSSPAMVIDDSFMKLVEEDHEAKMVFTDAVDTLPDEFMSRITRQRAYHGLQHWIEDIIKTNASPLDIDGRRYFVLFPEVSVSVNVQGRSMINGKPRR